MIPIATSLPSPIEPDGTGSRPSTEGYRPELAVTKRKDLKLLRLTEGPIILRRRRKDATECLPEGKWLVLLLHGFVVDGVCL